MGGWGEGGGGIPMLWWSNTPHARRTQWLSTSKWPDCQTIAERGETHVGSTYASVCLKTMCLTESRIKFG